MPVAHRREIFPDRRRNSFIQQEGNGGRHRQLVIDCQGLPIEPLPNRGLQAPQAPPTADFSHPKV
jgi:hypothetical protein